MHISETQKDQLTSVLSDQEREGATRCHVPLDHYAASAFELWHRDNECLFGDAAVTAFCTARRTAISALKAASPEVLSILAISEGADPIAQAARLAKVNQARRRF
jgi:hypothetical protein